MSISSSMYMRIIRDSFPGRVLAIVWASGMFPRIAGMYAWRLFENIMNLVIMQNLVSPDSPYVQYAAYFSIVSSVQYLWMQPMEENALIAAERYFDKTRREKYQTMTQSSIDKSDIDKFENISGSAYNSVRQLIKWGMETIMTLIFSVGALVYYLVQKEMYQLLAINVGLFVALAITYRLFGLHMRYSDSCDNIQTVRTRVWAKMSMYKPMFHLKKKTTGDLQEIEYTNTVAFKRKLQCQTTINGLLSTIGISNQLCVGLWGCGQSMRQSPTILLQAPQ